MGYCRKLFNSEQPGPIEADKIDAWAAGISLLELATNSYPFDLVDLREKVLNWDAAYFQRKLDVIDDLRDPAPGSVMGVIKGLLDLNLQTRLNVEEALEHLHQKHSFSDLHEQQETFAALKASEATVEVSPPPREKDENYLDVYLKNRGVDPEKASYEAIQRYSRTPADESYAKTPSSVKPQDMAYTKTPA